MVNTNPNITKYFKIFAKIFLKDFLTICAMRELYKFVLKVTLCGLYGELGTAVS